MLKSQTQSSTWQTHAIGYDGLEDAVMASPELAHLRRERLYLAIKRAFDVALALCLLVLLSPLLALVALAIKLDSPGPIIHIQKRVGKGGRVFSFHKFRSMTDGDHTEAHRQFAKQFINGNTSSPHGLQKPPTALRAVTRVGRFLRKTSLDELPQLVCILKGDMSFVGPRPVMAYEAEEFKHWHWRRVEVLPGLTGLAQINGRSRLTFDEIVRMDIRYIEVRSMRQDLSILVRTIPQVLVCLDAG